MTRDDRFDDERAVGNVNCDDLRAKGACPDAEEPGEHYVNPDAPYEDEEHEEQG